MTDEFWALATASPGEVAKALGLPYESVLAACSRGEIPHQRWGRRIIVEVQALRRALSIDEPVDVVCVLSEDAVA